MYFTRNPVKSIKFKIQFKLFKIEILYERDPKGKGKFFH